MASRILTFVLAVAFLCAAWLAYDNVYSDVEPTRALAEAEACRVKDCKKHHGMTKLERSPAGQSFEYTWEDGTVRVSCRRGSLLIGAMRCESEKP